MQFQYNGDEARTYPDLSLEVAPGDVVELDEAPADGRFSEVTAKKTKKETGDAAA